MKPFVFHTEYVKPPAEKQSVPQPEAKDTPKLGGFDPDWDIDVNTEFTEDG